MARLTFHLIPHTHWDREWYLPRAQFGARLVPVVDDLLDLLEREDGIPAVLLDGQTVLLEDYLAVRDDQRDRVARLVASGRIETGPWYVLADEQIPAGESLARNLLLGRRDIEQWGGGLQVLYSPDAFGHPAVLPDLGAGFGIETAVLWRGIRSGTDLFHWKGPGGGSVLTYHLPPDGYEIGSALVTDSAHAARAWQQVRREIVSRAVSQQVAIFVGADHHAIRRDLPLLRDVIAGLEPEHEVRLSSLSGFFAAVNGAAITGTRTGELREHGYTWALQGVHGTRAPLKRRNSRAELWLTRYAEPLSALAARLGGRDRRPLLESAWRGLVQCHFHDSLGGCSADPVAREVGIRLESVEGAAREIVRGAVQDLAGHDPDLARRHPQRALPTLFLWNPVPRTRGGIVLAQLTRFRRDVLVGPPGNRVPREEQGSSDSLALVTASGELVPVQVLSREPALERLDAAEHYPDQDEVEQVRIAFESPEVKGLGAVTLTEGTGSPVPAWGGAAASRGVLSNEHLEVDVSRNGSLTVLHRASGLRASRILQLESESDLGDTYTFSPAMPGRKGKVTGVRSRVLAAGPLVAALEVSGRVIPPPRRDGRPNGTVRFSWLIMLLRDDPVLRATLRLVNYAEDHRLRFRVAGGDAGRAALAGAQFGTIRRAVAVPVSQSQEDVVPTAPAHRFVAVPGAVGVALFAPGFFEYELEPGGDVLVTVLRSVGSLSRNDLATRRGHAGWPTPTPEAQCPGFHRLEVGLAQGVGEPDPGQLERSWEDIFLPLRAAWHRDWTGSAPEAAIELEGLTMSSLKPAEDGNGMVLRCCHPGGEAVTARVTFHLPVAKVERVRLDEAWVGDVPFLPGQPAVELKVAPGEIVSLRLT